MIPASYELKRIVGQGRERFWRPGDLTGILTAPVYLFTDQERFDSDEVQELANRIAQDPICLPHDQVLFEVVDRRPDVICSVAYVRRAFVGAEASLLRRYRSGGKWTDVLCTATYQVPGFAEFDANPRLLLKDGDIYAEVLTAIIFRALALLSLRPACTEMQFPSTRRPKLARAGVSGWTWRMVDIDLSRVQAATRQAGGTHASPRWHIRRGHWRTLADGRRVFVQACEVGDATRGGVLKDYQVVGAMP
jgi:hypothetical protein